jgi:hypothetical protein
LICTFRTKVCSSLGDTTHLLPEQCDGCVVPWCLYLHTIVCTGECGTFRCLEIALKDEPDLWRSTILFWVVGEMICVMHNIDVLTDLPKLKFVNKKFV